MAGRDRPSLHHSAGDAPFAGTSPSFYYPFRGRRSISWHVSRTNKPLYWVRRRCERSHVVFSLIFETKKQKNDMRRRCGGADVVFARNGKRRRGGSSIKSGMTGRVVTVHSIVAGGPFSVMAGGDRPSPHSEGDAPFAGTSPSFYYPFRGRRSISWHVSRTNKPLYWVRRRCERSHVVFSLIFETKKQKNDMRRRCGGADVVFARNGKRRQKCGLGCRRVDRRPHYRL